MNTEPPIGEVPPLADPGTEQATGMPAGGDMMPAEPVPPMEAPVFVAETVFVETSDAPFVAPVVSETTAEYVIGDGLADAGAQPEAPAELSAVAEVADMADAYSPAAGAELAAAVDAAEAAAQDALDAEDMPPPPVEAPVAEVAPEGGQDTAETDELDDLLPGVSPVVEEPMDSGAGLAAAAEVTMTSDDVTPDAGLGLVELVAQAEEVAELAAEAADEMEEVVEAPLPEPGMDSFPEPMPEPVAELAPEPVPEPIMEAAPEPVFAPIADVVPEPMPESIMEAAPEPMPEPVAEVEGDADLDDLLPGVNPVAEVVIAESIAPVVDEAPVVEPVPELAAAPAEEEEELDDFLPEVDPLMVAMVVEDAAESATSEADAKAVLNVVDEVVKEVVAAAEADQAVPLVNVYPATPGELWLKIWARSLDFWMSPVTGAGKKD